MVPSQIFKGSFTSPRDLQKLLLLAENDQQLFWSYLSSKKINACPAGMVKLSLNDETVQYTYVLEGLRVLLSYPTLGQ